MERIRAFLKRHTLSAGFVAVLVPLLVLVGLQLNWLTRLARASAMAEEASLGKFLEAVGSDVEYTYRVTAEKVLDIPSSFLLEGKLDKLAVYWKKRAVEGVRAHFLMDYTRSPYGNLLYFDKAVSSFYTPPASDETMAIIAACVPFQLMGYERRRLEEASLTVDERDPKVRMILSPITDESSQIVGVAGMILDQDYFLDVVLPGAIKKAIPPSTDRSELADMMVSVRNAAGKTVFGAEANGGPGKPASASFPFVFRDWRISLWSASASPEQWAKAAFMTHTTLLALLTAAILGGAALALRAANRAMLLSEMKSDFVSNVSHELRTPIASIRVFAELLRLGRVSGGRIQEYGEYIEAESRRLSRLIDNILDFSRIESGRKTYRFLRADLGEVVASIVQTFEVRLRSSGFVIRYDPPPEGIPAAQIDPDAIGQALHNLLDNAVKYSGESREVFVRLRREGQLAAIEVEDRGIGIARGDHAKIFDRFHRVGSGLVHDVKGSGLGLSIVRHIVEAHRGTVSLSSEPGRGSVFTIRIPLSGQAEPAGEMVAEAEPGAGAA